MGYKNKRTYNKLNVYKIKRRTYNVTVIHLGPVAQNVISLIII